MAAERAIQLSTPSLAGARHLAAVAALEYEPCPRWCGGHTDKGGVRVHTGPVEVVVAEALVQLSVEVHDDGRGNVQQVFQLNAAGTDVQLSTGRMHDLMKAMERVFWKLDRSGNFLGSDPVVNDFRNGVRDRLRAAGISQAQLAREAHISPSLLSLILSGERVATAPIARSIEAALDAHVSITSLAPQEATPVFSARGVPGHPRRSVRPSPRTERSRQVTAVRRSSRDNRGGRA